MYLSFPVPRLPDVNLWSQMISDAFIIAVIGFAVSISMVCLYARKHKYETDSTQVNTTFITSLYQIRLFHSFLL